MDVFAACHYRRYCRTFFDKIQNPELKKVILVFSAGTIAVCIIAAVASVIA